MTEPTGWDIAATFGGIVTLLGSMGAGVRWFFRRHDSREAALDIKEAALAAKLEQRVGALEKETRDLWTVVSYVIPALHAHDPYSPALRMAAKILGDKFPIEINTPEDMIELLKKMP